MILLHHPAELTGVLLFDHSDGGKLLLKRHAEGSIEWARLRLAFIGSHKCDPCVNSALTELGAETLIDRRPRLFAGGLIACRRDCTNRSEIYCCCQR